MKIRDRDLHAMIDAYQGKAGFEPGPDEDSLRAAFNADPRFHRRVVDPTVRQCLAVIAAAFAVAVLILAVLAVTG